MATDKQNVLKIPEAPEASLMGIYECKPISTLQSVLRGDVMRSTPLAKQCIRATLEKAHNVAMAFAEVVNDDLVLAYLEDTISDPDWDKLNHLGLLVAVTYEESTDYSFSHAVWLEKLRRMRLVWPRISKDDDGDAKVKLLMAEFHQLQGLATVEPSTNV